MANPSFSARCKQLILVTIFACLHAITTHAQPSVTSGLLPKLSLSYSLPKGYKLDNSIESRQKLYGKNPFAQGNFAYAYVLTDFNTSLSKSIGNKRSIGVGYTLRISDVGIYHRALQQFTWTKIYKNSSLVNRFASDQTFGPKNSVQLRLRYRALFKIPLSDKNANSNGFYLKLGNEYLGIINSDKDSDIEIRLIPLLGYKINQKAAIEFGLDGRINKIFEKNSSLSIWVNLGFYASFGS
ncbi:MAG: DUF2490 domain-containing protein [Bacteroidales bacterium]|nr:DUF2490 domain-containing protein [Bacteroidales bacterium]MDD3891644.1 DUF2490 domain-containing protein [Bacteroidales bacterium]